jgi:hypothetical protein
MPPTTPIPRFLLPQAGMLWRNHIPPSQSNTLFIRTLSKQAAPKKSTTTSSNKPLVLEKPSKFNPPSHGARIRREAPRYPGPSLSAEEKAAQERKKYPNMMPSQGTFMYWFIHNRGIHLWITFVCSFSFLLSPHMSPHFQTPHSILILSFELTNNEYRQLSSPSRP